MDSVGWMHIEKKLTLEMISFLNRLLKRFVALIMMYLKYRSYVEVI